MGPTGLSMGKKHLKFIRVSVYNVVQLELHPFLTAAHVGRFDRHWFLDQHMKEVEGILQTVIASCQTWGSSLLKDKEVKKLTQTCLLGPTVRLGVTLKQKTEHQSLLSKSSCSTDYRSWSIQSIKLVGYVCPRLQGLTQSVSTAFGKLLQKREDMEHTDISSYFQPQPSTHSTLHTAPTSTTTSTFTTTSTTTTTVTSSRSCVEVVHTTCGARFAVHHQTEKECNKQPALSKLKRQTDREGEEKDQADDKSGDGREELGTSDSCRVRQEEQTSSKCIRDKEERPRTVDSAREQKKDHRTAGSSTEKKEEHRTADSPTEEREEHRTADSPTEEREGHRTADSPTEKREEHRTADSPIEKREEHRTADSPTEMREEHRTANSPSEMREGHRTADSPTEKREEHRTADSPSEMREEHRTAYSPTEKREEHRTASSSTEKREERRTANSPTEKREEHRTVNSSGESKAAHRKAGCFRESERREKHRTAKKERMEENRPAEKEWRHKVTTAEKERKEKIRKAEKERREKNRKREKEKREEKRTVVKEEKEENGTVEKENRKENGTAKIGEREEKRTAEKEKREEKRKAEKEKREEKGTAEKEKREEKGTADKEKREEKRTAEKEKREEKRTAEKEKREEKRTAEKEGRERLGKDGGCSSAREKSDRQGRSNSSNSKPWKGEASGEREQYPINRHSPPHTHTPPATPEGQRPPPPTDRHQTLVSDSQDKRAEVCNREQPMTPATKKGSKSHGDLSSDDSCLGEWELPDITEPRPKVMPHSVAQGHKLSLSRANRSPSCSVKTTTTSSSTHGAGKNLGRTGMGDKKAKSPDDQRSKGNQFRTSSGSGSDKSDDSRESACKKPDHSKPPKHKSDPHSKAPQKRSFQLVDIDFGFSSPEVPSKKKCFSSPSGGVRSHQAKTPKSEESFKQTHKKPCLDDRIGSQEKRNEKGEIQCDRKTEKRSSSLSCDVKTPTGSVSTKVAGAPPNFKKSRKLGLQKGAVSRPDTLSLQRSLFPTSTSATLPKRKDFKHTATSKQRKGHCEDWLPSLSPLACGKAVVSPQTEGRSDSDTSSVTDSSSGPSPGSSASKHARRPPSTLSKLKNSPRLSSKTAMACVGKTSGRVYGSPQASVSILRSASTPKSSRTLPGTPTSPRMADIQPGSPNTPKASGTPQTWPNSPESTATRKHSHQHSSQIPEAACSGWVESQSEDWLPNLDEAWCSESLPSCASSSKTLCDENLARTQSKSGRGVVDVYRSSHNLSPTPEQPSVKNCSRKRVKRHLPSSPENNGDPVLKKRCRKVLGKRSPQSSFAESHQSEDVDADTSVRCLGWVSDERLQQLINEFKDDLTAISQGTLYSHRHQLYIKGGLARRQLDYTSNLQYFASGQEDAVMDILMTTFARSLLLQEVDYLLRVLLPEALTRIYKQVTGRNLPQSTSKH